MAEEIFEKDLAPRSPGSDISRALVEGWSLEKQDLTEMLEELIGDEVPEAFDSREEVAEFVLGRGRYSDRNSFLYDQRDAFEMNEEGYFQDYECHLCLEEGNDDPELSSDFNQVEKDSFRPGYEKSRDDHWYRCKEHGTVHIVENETRYEEK